MKDSESQKSTSRQSTTRLPKPFFGAAPDRAFFAVQRRESLPFFQPKPSLPTVQKQVQEEEKPLQTKGDDRQHTSVGAKNQTSLPDNLKSGIENLSGMAMDDVKVHYNSDKPAELQALAYTQGTDIHVAPGQEKHLAHEAWHVVQQKQGRVQPTVQAQGVAINDDLGLEKEADVMGARAIQKQSAPGTQMQYKSILQKLDQSTRYSGGVTQMIVANAADTGLTKNMTALFIDRHVLNGTASTAIAPANATPPRETADGTYVRDRNYGNTQAAYAQALNRFNNIGATQTHILEIPNNYPEYEPGKRMNVKTAKRSENGHVDIIVDAGWRFDRIAVNAATPGLSENANVGGLNFEAILRSSSTSSRKARLGVNAGQINHYPHDKNPFLH